MFIDPYAALYGYGGFGYPFGYPGFGVPPVPPFYGGYPFGYPPYPFAYPFPYSGLPYY